MQKRKKLIHEQLGVQKVINYFLFVEAIRKWKKRLIRVMEQREDELKEGF